MTKNNGRFINNNIYKTNSFNFFQYDLKIIRYLCFILFFVNHTKVNQKSVDYLPKISRIMMKSIQDDLSQEIYSAVDKILGADVLESEKQDHLDSLLFIFHQQEKEIMNTLSAKGNPKNDII